MKKIKYLFLILNLLFLMFSTSCNVKGKDITDEEFTILYDAIMALENGNYTAEQNNVEKRKLSISDGEKTFSESQHKKYFIEYKQESNKSYSICTDLEKNKKSEWYKEKIDEQYLYYEFVDNKWESINYYEYDDAFTTFSYFNFSLKKECFTKNGNIYYGKYDILDELLIEEICNGFDTEGTKVSVKKFEITVEDNKVKSICIKYEVSITEENSTYFYSYDFETNIINYEDTKIDININD